MANRPDVFISYRREAGPVAQLLKTKLEQRGFDVFLDVAGLGPGRFDETLLESIRRARETLVILSPGSLDRCSDPDDWFRREIAHALELGKKLIPVQMPGFVMPGGQELPEDVRGLVLHQSVAYSPDFVDATVDKLTAFLHPPGRRIRSLLMRVRPGAAAGLSALAVLLVAGWLGIGMLRNRPTPSMPFTIGYLQARAVWTVIDVLKRSQRDSAFRHDLAGELSRNAEEWPPQQSVGQITDLTRRLGWDWQAYLGQLESLVGSAGMLSCLSVPGVGLEMPGAPTPRFLEVVASLEDQSRRMLAQTGEPDIGEAAREMVLAGIQIGKIDELVRQGTRNGTLDRVLPSCRTFLRAMFDGLRTPESRRAIEPILASCPGVEAKVETIGEPALRDVIVRFKKRFLYGMRS